MAKKSDASPLATNRRGSGPTEGGLPSAVVPAPHTESKVERTLLLKDMSTPEVLAETLRKYDLETSSWGTGNTKDVSKFWKEIQQDEAALEIWRTKDGKGVPMRVLHVLRAKVSSPEAYERGMFLLNTGQQFGDGRRRMRNGLLSEKLTLSEMPLSEHLMEVCRRAVTEEEMAVVVDSAVDAALDILEYDPDYVCPLQVESAQFVDHTVEIEKSKSYPGLNTVYHLYTVDILCSGLPPLDFNTLEFDHPDADGTRPLKYVHQWVWQTWATIQRYLFDGSKMKERKTKGSFQDLADFERWMLQFDLNIDAWDTGSTPPLQALYNELEREETQLELWGRHDGVPLLMRVVHVIQCKLTSSDARKEKQFLFQIWHQSSDGRFRDVNRTMAKKLSTRELPFDEARFTAEAKQVVKSQLSYLADVHVLLEPDKLPTEDSLERSSVTVEDVCFSNHRTDLEKSLTFKDLTTMYHLYTVEVECTGLPTSDFASIVFHKSTIYSLGWRWVTWQQTLDIMHERSNRLEQTDALLAEKLSNLSEACAECVKELGEVKPDRKQGIWRSSSRSSRGLSPAEETKKAQMRTRLQKMLEVLASSKTEEDDQNVTAIHRLPPSMISSLADRKLVADSLLENCVLPHRMQSMRSKSTLDQTYASMGVAISTEVEGIEQDESNKGLAASLGIQFCCM